MPSIANATPQSRAKELPDEFTVNEGQLFCKWCNKVLYSLRKDNIHEHLYSRVHQDNRRSQGALMSYNPDCPERMKRKAARKLAQKKRKQEKQMQEQLEKKQKKMQEELRDIDSYQSLTLEQGFDNIFASDSDTSSFEGFPYLGDNSSAAVDIQTPVIAKISEPPKKQRNSSRKSRSNQNKINLHESWDGQSSDNEYYVSYKNKAKIAASSSYVNIEDISSEEDSKTLTYHDRGGYDKTAGSSVAYDFEDSDIHMNNTPCEVVETEIVTADEGNVVTWDSYLGQKGTPRQDKDLDIGSIVDESSNQTSVTNQITEEQHLAERVSHAREMAKSVHSTDFKKKIKKSTTDFAKAKPWKTSQVKKQKQPTGYMLWANKMRKRVAGKFPGLAFGEVSKKLGELWKKCPEKDKQMWKFRSEKMTSVIDKSSDTVKRRTGSKMIETGPPKKRSTSIVAGSSASLVSNSSHLATSTSLNLIDSFGTNPPHKNPEQQMERELAKLPKPSIQPIDSAAHLHIMGEHLVKLGDHIQSTGSCNTSEVVPKVLDSLLCTIAPLLTLVKQVKGLEDAVPDSVFSNMYANIAHMMPVDN